jgi:hypothetical protein
LGDEAIERGAKLGLECEQLVAVCSTAKLSLEVATGVRHAQVGSILCLEGATLRTAKRTAGEIRVRRLHLTQGGPGELQRGELVAREQGIGAAPAAVTSGPAPERERVSLGAAATGRNFAKGGGELLSQSSEIERKLQLLGIGVSASWLASVTLCELGQIFGAPLSVSETTDQMLSRDQNAHPSSIRKGASRGPRVLT